MSTLYSFPEKSIKPHHSKSMPDPHLMADQTEPHFMRACEDAAHEQQNSAAVLEDVCLAFGNLEVLHQVSATFKRGEITAVVGPNGSGKTSLLRILAGFVQPTVGTACMHGIDTIAMAEQTIGADYWMPLRVRDVLAMGRYGAAGMLRRLSVSDRFAIADAARRMDVNELMSRQVGELSVGQRRRVRLAMCLAQRADLLLLDEPESGLDMSSHDLIFAEMDKERGRGAAVVLATHTLSEAARSDHVVLLNKGVLAQGGADEVLREENLRRAYGLAEPR